MHSDRGLREPVTPPPPLEVALFSRIVRLAQRATLQVEGALAEQGLSVAQLSLLSLLSSRGALTQREVAESLGTTASNISQLLGKLEAAGLVAREVHGTTRPTALTATGAAVLARLRPTHDALIAAQFAPLAPAERQMLLLWLDRLLPPEAGRL